ncbi:MAG: hypothetical protein V9G19_12845 [Tetrasphaera sp.]
MTNDRLFLLGILNEDFPRPLVQTYQLDTMSRISTTTLTRPGEDYFVAALFAP